MANPSVVNDPATGSNFGQIKQDTGVNGQHQEYLDMLLKASQANTEPLAAQQYNPSQAGDEVIGQVSNQTMGSMPIFGSSIPVFSQAVLDQFNVEKKNAEMRYVKAMSQFSRDKLAINESLNNPFADQQYQDYIQTTSDKWLEAAMQKTGGNSQEAIALLSVDKDYAKWRKQVVLYDQIFQDTAESAKKVLDANDDQVVPAIRKAAISFLYDKYDIFNDGDKPNMEKLLERTKTFQTHMSLFEVAQNLSEGLSEKVRDNIIRDYGVEAGTDSKVYKKETYKGVMQEDVNNMLKSAVDFYWWLEEDDASYNLLKTQLEKDVDKSYQVAFETIKKDTAARTDYLNKNGVKLDKNGRVVIGEVVSSFAMVTPSMRKEGKGVHKAKNGFNYPYEDMNGEALRVKVPANSLVYIRGNDGTTHQILLPNGYDVQPISEYDMSKDMNSMINPGRYTEAFLNIEEERVYNEEKTEAVRQTVSTTDKRENGSKTVSTSQPVTKDGRVVEYPTGQYTQAKREPAPVMVKDFITGQTIPLDGKYTLLIPHEFVKDRLQGVLPYLESTYERLDKRKASSKEEIPEQISSNVPNPDQDQFIYQGGTYAYNDLREAGWTDDQINSLQKA